MSERRRWSNSRGGGDPQQRERGPRGPRYDEVPLPLAATPSDLPPPPPHQHVPGEFYQQRRGQGRRPSLLGSNRRAMEREPGYEAAYEASYETPYDAPYVAPYDASYDSRYRRDSQASQPPLPSPYGPPARPPPEFYRERAARIPPLAGGREPPPTSRDVRGEPYGYDHGREYPRGQSNESSRGPPPSAYYDAPPQQYAAAYYAGQSRGRDVDGSGPPRGSRDYGSGFPPTSAYRSRDYVPPPKQLSPQRDNYGSGYSQQRRYQAPAAITTSNLGSASAHAANGPPQSAYSATPTSGGSHMHGSPSDARRPKLMSSFARHHDEDDEMDSQFGKSPRTPPMAAVVRVESRNDSMEDVRTEAPSTAVSPSGGEKLTPTMKRRVIEDSSDSDEENEEERDGLRKVTTGAGATDKLRDGDNDTEEEDKGEREEAERSTADADAKLTTATITVKMDALDDEISKYEEMLESVRKMKMDTTGGEAAVTVSSKASPPVRAKPATKTAAAGITPRQRPRAFLKKDEDDLVQRIYRENQKRIKRAMADPNLLSPLKYDGNEDDQMSGTIGVPASPLYRDPSELPFYAETIEKHKHFRQTLMRHIGQRKRATCEKQAELRGQYLSMERDWLEKVVTFEAHQRKKQIALEQKLASRSTSTRGFQGNTANDPIGYARLIPPNPEEEYRYTRTLAVVPPMLMDEHEREDVRYVDENRQFDESVQSLRNFNQLNPWTAEEKQVFLQKWVEYPKEFGQIATHLPNKTAQDCVLFYYLQKKDLKIKSITKQALAVQARRRRKAAAAAAQGSADNNVTQSAVSEAPRTAGWAIAAEDSPPRQVPTSSASHRPAAHDAPFEEDTWQPDEVVRAKEAFLLHGKDFIAVAQFVTTRTIMQCRRLYMEYKQRRGMDLTDAESTDLPKKPPSPVAVSLPAPKEKKPKQPKSSTLTGNKEKQRHVSEEPTSTDLARGERDTNTGGDSESMKRSRPSRVTDDEGAGGSASGAPESVSSVVDGGQVAATAAATKRRTASYWSTAERARFAQLFTEHGRNYQLLSELLGTKSEIQVRNYYRNNRSALGMAQDHPPGAHAMDSMSSHDEGGPDAVSSSDETSYRIYQPTFPYQLPLQQPGPGYHAAFHPSALPPPGWFDPSAVPFGMPAAHMQMPSMFAAPNPGRPLPPPPHLQYNLPPLKLFQQPHEPKPLPVTVLDEKKLDTVAPAKGFKVGQEDVTMVQDMATTKDAKNTEQDVALTTPMDVALTTPMDVDLVPSIPGNIEEASTEHGNAMEIPNEAVAKAEATVGVEQAPLDLANTVDTSAIETGGPGSAHTVTVADSTDSVDSVTTNDAPTKKKRTTNRRTPVVESQPTMTSPKRSARNSAKSEGSTSGAAAAAASVQTAAQASTPIASEESVKSSATTLAPTDDSVRNGRTRKKSNPVKATETPADVVGAKVNAEPTSSSRASGRRSASSPKRK